MDNTIIDLKDWSEVKNSVFKDKDFDPFLSETEKSDYHYNLGIYKDGDTIRTKSYVGIVRLVDQNKETIRDKNGEVFLKISSRFGFDPFTMLDKVLGDEEYESYVSGQKDDMLYELFVDQKPICINHEVENGEKSSEKSFSLIEGNLMPAITFVRLCTDICRRQLKPQMQYQEENLTGKVKGKIVHSKNIRKNLIHGREDRIFCRFISQSIDTPENRILKAALLKAEKIISDSKKLNNLMNMCHYCRTALNKVKTVKITDKDFSGLHLTGYYAYYKGAVSVAKLLLSDNLSLSANYSENTGSKNIYIIPYVIKMEALFEFYIRAILKEKVELYPKDGKPTDNKIYLHPYKPYSKLGGYRILKQDIPKNTDYTHLIKTFYPDIILEKDKKIYVYDVKYKYAEKASRSDTYQILSYMLLLDTLKCGFIMPFLDEMKNNIENTDIKSMVLDSDNGKRYFENFFIKSDTGLQKIKDGEYELSIPAIV